MLEPGMAFSVEPGFYLLDRFGARIEDIVVVTHDGVELLNLRPATSRSSSLAASILTDALLTGEGLEAGSTSASVVYEVERRPQPSASYGGADAGGVQAFLCAGNIDRHDRRVTGGEPEPGPEPVGQRDVVRADLLDAHLLEQVERQAVATQLNQAGEMSSRRASDASRSGRP